MGFNIERADKPFVVKSPYKPSGDQPKAIEELAERIENGENDVVLMGATGTGKTATTAWLIERLQRPTLIIEPNKTLAAQLCAEFRELMPDNAVSYWFPTTTTTSRRHTSPDRHLYRKGFQHQRRCGAIAPRSHRKPSDPPRLRGRGHRLLHLRFGNAGRIRWSYALPQRKGSKSTVTIYCANSWTCSTSATTSPSREAHSACAAIRLRSSPSTRNWPCASNSSATRLTASPLCIR